MGGSASYRDEDAEFRQAAELLARRTRTVRLARSAADLLSQVMARRGFAQLQWAEQLEHAWQRAAGELAQRTAPGNLRRGALEIIVGNSSVMQQLAFDKPQLLENMQRFLPEANIRDLRFRVGTV